jgi:phosphoribosylformylglycinamidine synthase
VQRATLDAIRSGLVRSAHDVSDGGILVALAEAAIAGNRGADVDLAALAAADNVRLDGLCFGEGGSRIVLEVAPEDEAKLALVFAQHAAPHVVIGSVGGLTLRVRDRDWVLMDESVDALAEAWRGGLSTALTQGDA